MSQPESRPEYSFVSHADLPGASFDAVRQAMMAVAQSGDMAILEDTDVCLTVETAQGLMGLRPGSEAEVAVMVAARDPLSLYMMKRGLPEQIRDAMTAETDSLVWVDGETDRPLPPNFQFMRAIAVEELSPVFWRVTLEGDDVSTYGEDSIHFRLVQPVHAGGTEWPTVAPNGSAKWTDGPGAPHKPVYTVRAVDYDKGQILTDVYLHDGGKTMEWAAEIQQGQDARAVIGLMGPMGGGLIRAPRLLMACDETGMPAAARILENLPEDTVGEIYLESDVGDPSVYPIAPPEGMRVTWLSRSKGDRLLDVVLTRHQDYSDAPIWFAGEKEQARQLREITKDAGYESDNLRISGFWRDES